MEPRVNYSQALVDFVVDKAYDDLPAEVVTCTKRLILDTLACAVGGHAVASQQILRNVVGELGGTPEATVLVSGERTSAPMAAFVNSDMAHSLDADETLYSALHVGAVVAISALAAAERAKVSGKQFITAVALGYEVAVRIGFSLVNSRVLSREVEASDVHQMAAGTHVHGLGCAVIGSAMAAGKLFNLQREKMAHAMGIAGAICPSPVGGKLNGGLRLSCLKVMPRMVLGQSAVLSAVLAERGYTGDQAILDGENGFWRFQGALDSNWSHLKEGLGEKWWIRDSAVKPYPACRFVHHSLDLLYKIMREQKLGFDDIQSITVSISPSKKRMIATSENHDLPRDHSDPATVTNMLYHIPYILAVAALGIPPGPRWYKVELLNDTKIRDFIKKVSIKAHPRAIAEEMRTAKEESTGRSKAFPTSLSILAKGQTFEAETDYATGDPYFPETKVSDEGLKEKFRNFCDDALPAQKIEQAIQTAFALEQLDDISKLVLLVTK